MALIKCPDCGKEVSSRAPACPNCGCPITGVEVPNKTTQYKAKITHRAYRSKFNRWLLEANIQGNFINGSEYEQGDTVMLCDERGQELATLELSTYCVIPNLPVVTFGFDSLPNEIANKTAYVVKATNEPSITNINNQVVCPKCGSTQIQIVRRNYSIWTGFMTNKVDRVCANCMHKF